MLMLEYGCIYSQVLIFFLFFSPVISSTFLSLFVQRALNSFFEADMERVFDVEELPEKDTTPKAKRQKVEDAPAANW